MLANKESYNSTLIEEGLSQQERIVKLNDMARNQMQVFLKELWKLVGILLEMFYLEQLKD